MSSTSQKSLGSVSKLRRRIYLVCRLALAVLMIGVGVTKAAHMEDFADHIGDFGIVPLQWNEATAWLLVVTEVTIGLGPALPSRLGSHLARWTACRFHCGVGLWRGDWARH